ncbi:hypothetical protein Y032_0569g78 [Ancylostoma ceylanicum]|uniref:Uncharacterized protein n=1 Tax=Ancylostoma ceylanicum TaxID=53326 RepID=A0A016WNN9_9BILA|nr:hypothetical protein Y032_0569g78 [Ancylostoma ceylanicum]
MCPLCEACYIEVCEYDFCFSRSLGATVTTRCSTIHANSTYPELASKKSDTRRTNQFAADEEQANPKKPSSVVVESYQQILYFTVTRPVHLETKAFHEVLLLQCLFFTK